MATKLTPKQKAVVRRLANRAARYRRDKRLAKNSDYLSDVWEEGAKALEYAAKDLVYWWHNLK